MKITPLQPDVPAISASEDASTNDIARFGKSLDAVGKTLNNAEAAENAYAAGNGSLQDAVFERAQADVVLSIATAAAGRGAQALQSILNMQI